jgi:hypothetical protein
MREIRSYGSVGERGGDEPLYPESPLFYKMGRFFKAISSRFYFESIKVEQFYKLTV